MTKSTDQDLRHKITCNAHRIIEKSRSDKEIRNFMAEYIVKIFKTAKAEISQRDTEIVQLKRQIKLLKNKKSQKDIFDHA